MSDGILLMISGTGADEEVLVTLLDEVTAVHGVAAERAVAGPGPEGSKSLGIEVLGIALKAGAGSIPGVIGSVVDWLTRQRPDTSVRFEKDGQVFEVKGQMRADQIDALIAKLT